MMGRLVGAQHRSRIERYSLLQLSHMRRRVLMMMGRSMGAQHRSRIERYSLL